jgi:uncharacterized MnhB-related membrane protein
MWWQLLIGVGTLVCAVLAVSARRLLVSAIWLAGASALTALLMYLLGAPEIAVIELSVGAGLVTVLFVFAINIAGEESLAASSLLPKPLAWALVLAAGGMLAWMTYSAFAVPVPDSTSQTFGVILWENRWLDVMMQIVLVFAGMLGVLGLLADPKPAAAAEDKA